MVVVCLALAGVAQVLASHRAAAQAPALEISPIMIALLPDQMATTFTVTNTGTEPTTVQLRPFQWDQQGGTDHLTDTDALVVSPPITQIDANQTQTFRVVLTQHAAGSEASYRLLLDQLPPPAQPGLVRVALRVSLPVFAAAADATPANLVFSLARDDRGLTLIGRNLGGQHTRVIKPELLQTHGPALVLETGQNPYILPGMEKHWRLTDPDAARPGAQLRLAANSDAGPVDARLDVPPH